jgi:CubicO group peptidase (beta-lactamase class C family)
MTNDWTNDWISLTKGQRVMCQKSTCRLFLLPLLLLLVISTNAQDLDARLKEIDAYAIKAGQDWKVPGFAIAIVKEDKVLFAKGYGVRELGKPEAVDKDTLFAIASNSTL